MKLGVVFVIALACKLASCEVYYDQSGYGYGVNPKPSGSPDDETLSSVNVPSKEPINSQESKPKAYLVRLKPKDDLESSAIPNKKSKFLLLLRLPEDHEETQATSLTSEVQQKDESGYQQSDIPTQDNFAPSLIQTPYSSFENQKDESGQYQQQPEPQQYQQQPQYQQQQQQEEAVVPQQNDSGYLQPLQTDGYGQSQSNEQAQQKDETYSQQQPQPQPQQQQQQQQYDVTEDFDKQAKDDSGYQQQSYSQQQDSGYGSVSAAFPSQTTSAFKNGFSPLPNYERPQVQQQMPAVDSVKGLRNNFFRAPVLQDTQKITNTYGSNDFQSRENESFEGQLEQVKNPATKSQPASQSTYGLNSGTKTSTYSEANREANRDATKGSFQPSFYPSSDSSRKSATPTIHSSYPSQQSPMKSPAQVYAQQQQQQQQQKQQQEIEPARKTITSPVKDFYGQSAQPESNSYGSQQGFSSEYGSNEESIKSASPVKDSSSYGTKQEGIKTPPKQSYENVQSSPIVNDYSNTFNNPQSFSQAPISSSFTPSFGYGVQQQLQEQPQQQVKQDDYNQAVQNNEDLQEKDEQSEYSPEQQENEEPEKKMPVLLVPVPPESSPYAPSDNQKKENYDSQQQQQQTYDSQQKSESDFQQSSGSLGNDESSYNAPVKGQAPISNYEQSTQTVQTDSYGQQPSSVGQKSPSLRFPTKSSIKTQQPIQSSSGYNSGVSSSSVKGGRAPQQSSYNNDYSSGFQAAPKDTKSAKPSPSLDNSYSSATKGGQTSDEGFSNEQKTSVKGSNQPTKGNAVQSSYSAALQPPVKAARAFQQSAGYSSEVKSTKGVSESYSKPSQSPVESNFNDYQATPVQQQSQPEQPQQQKQTQADLGYNLRAPTKGGRAQSQQSNTESSYSSNSQSSFNSDYQSSSVKGGATSQQQNSYPLGFSSAFSSSPAQQTSGYGSSFYQSLPSGVKGSQNSQIQQQQSDAESLPNQTSQPAFASFSASVKGSAPVAPQTQQNFDDGYSSGFQAPIASSAPVQQTQSDRGYSSVPQSSGVKGGQQVASSYEQSPLPNVSGTKSSLNQPKAPLTIPNYRTKAGRSQLSSTKSSKTAPSNQKSPISSYPSFPISQQTQQTQPEQQQDTKGAVKPQPQPNTKTALKNPSTSYLPALSPPSATKSTYSAPPQSKSPQQDSSYFPLPVNSQQQLQSPKNAPLTRGLPPPPALVARSRPSQSFNFPSSQSQVQPSSESYPSYSASSNTPVFDDEEDAMSITADDMGAYGLRTNSPYDATAASATSHLRAVEQPQGSGRVVLLLFNKEHPHSQASRMSLSPDSRGIY